MFLAHSFTDPVLIITANGSVSTADCWNDHSFYRGAHHTCTWPNPVPKPLQPLSPGSVNGVWTDNMVSWLQVEATDVGRLCRAQ